MQKTKSNMDSKHGKAILFAAIIGIIIWIIWYANGVFLLAFASILLAIFLTAVGKGTKKMTRLPYPLALLLALVLIFGILTLTFWLYSPLISDQFELLMDQLPQAASNVQKYLAPYLGSDFFHEDKLQKTFSLSNQKIFSQIITLFSSTLGSIVGFVVFLIVGLYLAIDPKRYVRWVIMLVPSRRQQQIKNVMVNIGQSLRWWILGKLLSMAVVGICTFIGLSLLHVNLAFILGFLSALLTFIPYVGAILSSIPAILIAFAQSPWTALYVIILYIGIHLIDGYFITPYIEQRTVSIPPALSIMAQMLLTVLVGGLGLALATPLTVVFVALIHFSAQSKHSLKVAQQSQEPDDD